MSTPELPDAEVAAATFDLDLRAFFSTGRGQASAWERFNRDELHAVIRIPALRTDGTVDHYFLLLGAEYYDVWPVSVAFVRPSETGDWPEANEGTRWWPSQRNAPGFPFQLHASYQYPDGSRRQLLCFSHSFDYYLTNHTPTERERWTQGIHTVSATLSRVAQVLQPPNYVGPAGDSDS